MTTEQARTADPAIRRDRLPRVLGTAILVLLVVLLVEVILESYVQVQLGARSVVVTDGQAQTVVDVPQWPKTLKSALYIMLALLALAKVGLERRWRSFTGPADLALIAVTAAFVVIGFIGDSSPTLIGEALFVYFRGVIVFYAWRALNPTWSQVKPALWIVGGLIAVNAAIAIVQMFGGYPTYRLLNWVDMTWANKNRAHALTDHPNHLGHITSFMLLGLVAWFVSKPRVGRGWWALFLLVALGMSATQSRESLIAFICGAILIGILRRGGRKVVVAALAVTVLFAGLQLAFQPAKRAELARRLVGVFAAFEVPAGEEDGRCTEGNAGCENGITAREVRIMYLQEGTKLWLEQPIFGYGVGQFGGIVAYNDAEKRGELWYRHPQFAPGGGFESMDSFREAKQVDSFWLHLVIEVGAIGLLFYLAWLWFLGRPFLQARVRKGKKGTPVTGPTSAEGVHPMVYWAPSALLFSVLVAALSISLEDPMLPPLLFSILGVGWVVLEQGRTAGMTPATGPDAAAAPASATLEEPARAASGDRAPNSAPATKMPSTSADRPGDGVTACPRHDSQDNASGAPTASAAAGGADSPSRGAYGAADRDS